MGAQSQQSARRMRLERAREKVLSPKALPREPRPQRAPFTGTHQHSPARLGGSSSHLCWLCFWRQIHVEWSQCDNNNRKQYFKYSKCIILQAKNPHDWEGE